MRPVAPSMVTAVPRLPVVPNPTAPVTRPWWLLPLASTTSVAPGPVPGSGSSRFHTASSPVVRSAPPEDEEEPARDELDTSMDALELPSNEDAWEDPPPLLLLNPLSTKDVAPPLEVLPPPREELSSVREELAPLCVLLPMSDVPLTVLVPPLLVLPMNWEVPTEVPPEVEPDPGEELDMRNEDACELLLTGLELEPMLEDPMVLELPPRLLDPADELPGETPPNVSVTVWLPSCSVTTVMSTVFPSRMLRLLSVKRSRVAPPVRVCSVLV